MSLTIQSGGSITLQGGSGGGGAISAVGSAWDATSYTVTSTSFSPLATSVAVTATTGTRALVSIAANLANPANQYIVAAVGVSGATTIAAAPQTIVTGHTSSTFKYATCARTFVLEGLTPGSNTFTLLVRVTGGSGEVTERSLVVQTLA